MISNYRVIGTLILVLIAFGVWMEVVTKPVKFNCTQCKQPLMALEVSECKSELETIFKAENNKAALLTFLSIDDRFIPVCWAVFCGLGVALARSRARSKYLLAIAVLVILAASVAAVSDYFENRELKSIVSNETINGSSTALHLFFTLKWVFFYLSLILISILFFAQTRWVKYFGLLLLTPSVIGLMGIGLFGLNDPNCSLLERGMMLTGIGMLLIGPLMTYCPREFEGSMERDEEKDKDKEKATDEVITAKEILRGRSEEPKRILELANALKKQKQFGYARKILSLARLDKRILQDPHKKLKVEQELSLCTYKDPDLSTDEKLERALEILERIESLEKTTNQENLGQAGGIFKRKWEFFSRREDLERSLYYYLRGSKLPPDGDQGYTAINAAFVLELLAAEELEEARKAGVLESEIAKNRIAQAKTIREKLIDDLPKLPGKPKMDWLNNKWFYFATVAEAYFGLGDYANAKEWIRKADHIKVDDWEKESTARQFAAIVRLQSALVPIGADKIELARTVLSLLAKGHQEGVESAIRGKIGLALSGGGFRASLFHIGVLAKLAEFDLLRSVEVLSCVSGGSIVGAQYFLEVKKKLCEKTDEEINKNDYIEIVKKVQKDFLDGVKKNIRTRVVLNPWKNLKMILSTYTRTERAGELFEKHLYSRTKSQPEECSGDGKNFWINKLRFEPKDWQGRFNPKNHNWNRKNKVPILVLNATTLNTGHNWHFTATYMGEPPGYINTEIDANYRLRRMYYGDAPEEYRNIRLGTAVGASACVPAIFDPIVFSNLYPNITVRLVDGGVQDNQGIGALLEQDCSIMLVSDASGQMDTVDHPGASIFNVLLRSNSIFQARVRDLGFRELQARRASNQLRKAMFIHLKKDLDADPVDWEGCQDPHEASDEARPASKRGVGTTYMIRKDIQRKLAAIRTDLDSFCEAEAYALMVSGYRMTEFTLPDSLKGSKNSNESKEAIAWDFLMIEPPMKDSQHPAHEYLKKVLDVGSKPAFKIWHLSCGLRYFTAFAALVALVISGLTLYPLRNEPIEFAATLAGISKWLFGILLIAAIGFIADVVLGKMGTVAIQAYQTQNTIRRTIFAVVMSLVGWLVALVHLLIFDRWYLKSGSLDTVLKGKYPKC